MIRLVLPEPPSVNRVWRKGKGGKLYLAPSVARFRAGVLRAVRDAGIKTPPFGPRTAVRYELVWYRSRKSGDLSNRLKALEDALNGLVWHDDRQVVGFTCARVDGDRPGRVEVTITRVAA